VSKCVKQFEEQVAQLKVYALTFGFPNVIEACEKYLIQMNSEISAYHKLWEHIERCDKVFSEYREMTWGHINTMEMEDDIKKLRKHLIDLKGIDKRSNVFQGIQEDLKRWATFLPLLSELKDPSMITEDHRHWIKMKSLVRKEFEVDDGLTLQTIWDLKLFDFKDGIEEITDQSKQELKMEKALNVIINFWKTIEFELVQHKSTTIRTLKLAEENFEMLEEHQLQINNMLLSKFIGFYEKAVEKWKQDLGSVYDVVQLLSDVQKTWSFLENLFIQSEEVKKELPKES